MRANNTTRQTTRKDKHKFLWHPCEHCRPFGQSVKILDQGSYAVGEAKDWDSAVSICELHNNEIKK